MIYTPDKAKEIYENEKKRYDEFVSLGLNLDMSRGKPNKEQLDISDGMFDEIYRSKGIIGSNDYRNYGILDGIPEAKKIFADLSGVTESQIIIMGNSSLNIMYDTVQRAMQFGVLGGVPFNKQGKIKWICPVPGYDRHFSVTEVFGIEMINVPMKSDGPDMDMIEELVKDESVKGVWCVPKYSNPQGIVYSDEVVERFAALKPAAKDFRIYWDNAYMIHYITEDVPLLNIFDAAKKYGNEDLMRRMFVLDALILNIDRHLGNVGFLFDNDTMRITGMAPIYDNNRSLLFQFDTEALEKRPEWCISKCEPRISGDFIKTAQAVLTDELRADLKNMVGFRFQAPVGINVPMDRLEALSRILNIQLKKILQ